MKKLTSIILRSTPIILPAYLLAAVPLRWTVETSRLQPVVFDAVHGETLALEAAFNSYGTPLQLASQSQPSTSTFSLFYQTNGMGSAWWTAAASVSSNRVSATFTPEMDPGAASVVGFLGATGEIYRAAFTIRFRHGPGALPNVIDEPVPVLDLAHTVVVNPPWPTTADFASATNSMTAYIDEHMAEAGLVSPTAVTNISSGVVSNIVTKSYVEGLGISGGGGGGVDTNAVRDIVASASVTNAGAVAAANYRISNLTGSQIEFAKGADTSIYGKVTSIEERIPDLRLDDGVPESSDVRNLFSTANATLVSTINTAGAGLTNGLVSTAYADAAYYPKASGEAWSTYWDGDDVRVTVTNYDSSVNLPSLYLEQRTNETAMATNLFRTVWREMSHWDSFLGTNWNWRAAWSGFATWSAAVEASLDEKADRAWGFYDSHTGKYAPDGFTQISSSNVMIAAGMSYQKTVTTSAEVWVLTANEPYEPTGIPDSAGFQLKDSDGNVQFEIIKGDKVTVAAQPSAVTTAAATPASSLVVTYSVAADSHPTAEICLDISSADWKTETDEDCPATVTWTGSSGAWVATIAPKAATAKCFARATYTKGGDTYINNRCAVGLSQIVLNGTTYNLGTATIDGNTVLTLTPAN